MALSFVQYVGDGVTDTFNIPFGYLSQTDIQVRINGVLDTGITFPTTSTVKTTSIPAGGATVEVKRITTKDSLLVDFQDGSVLSESDLDRNAQQLIYVIQEALDTLVTVEQVNGLIVSGLNIKFPTIQSGDIGKGLEVNPAEDGYDLFVKGALASKDTVSGSDLDADAIDGSKIADNAIGNEHLQDNAVNTAEIVDDAVTLDKLASGVAGNLITYDASGDPAPVATGASGQMLVSNGAGAAPSFQDIGGLWTSISDTTVTPGASSISFALGSYPLQIIYGINVQFDTDDRTFELTVSDDNESTYKDNSYAYHTEKDGASNSTSEGSASNGAASFAYLWPSGANDSLGNDTGESGSFIMWIFDAKGTNNHKLFRYQLVWKDPGGNLVVGNGGFTWEGGTTALTNLKLTCEAGVTMDAARFIHVGINL